MFFFFKLKIVLCFKVFGIDERLVLVNQKKGKWRKERNGLVFNKSYPLLI